jgi:type VI secretion system protein ImpL
MRLSGQFSGSSLPDVYRLGLAGRGHYADFELRASSVENPYSLEMFARFTCPENI